MKKAKELKRKAGKKAKELKRKAAATAKKAKKIKEKALKLAHKMIKTPLINVVRLLIKKIAMAVKRGVAKVGGLEWESARRILLQICSCQI